MGKKKKVNIEEVPAAISAHDVINRMKKSFGDEIFVRGRDIVEDKKKVIPVSPKIDYMLGGGIPEGSVVVSTGPPKVGKEQPLYSMVMTPNGPVPMGNIAPGDKVCTPKGTIATVLNVYDNGKKDVYRITFADESYVDCGLEHLWSVKSRWQEQRESRTKKKYKDQILTTEEIINRGLFVEDARPKWSIELPSPVLFKEQSISIPPYILGLLLGDGSFRRAVSFTSIDKELVNEFKNYISQDHSYKVRVSEITYFASLKERVPKNKYNRMIMKLGLFNKKSKDKFIPKNYLYNTLEIRRSILQGLMDTDGTVDTNGNCSYSSTSYQLSLDVKFLVESLGGLATIKPKKSILNGKTFFSYTVYIKTNNNKELFRLKRKVDRCSIRTKNPIKRRIVDISKIGRYECRCIRIDDEDHLYLTDNFVVTHNTTMCLHAASIAQRPENNSKFGPRHVFFHNIEMRLKERDLRGIHGLDLDNQFTSIESKPKNIITAEKHVEIALQWFHEVPGCIVIFDSFSSLLTQGRLDNEIGKRFRDDAPSLLSDFLRRAAPVIVTNNCILMGVTHMISNQSPMSKSPWVESSGRKLQYACDVKLKATHFTPWKSGSGDDAEQIGQDVHWKCDWSALGPPGTECQSKLRYGYGIDKEAELIDICSELAIIKKGGAWYTFPNEMKFQGLENARNYLVENPDVYLEIYNQYRELLGYKDED